VFKSSVYDVEELGLQSVGLRGSDFSGCRQVTRRSGETKYEKGEKNVYIHIYIYILIYVYMNMYI